MLLYTLETPYAFIEKQEKILLLSEAVVSHAEIAKVEPTVLSRYYITPDKRG